MHRKLHARSEKEDPQQKRAQHKKYEITPLWILLWILLWMLLWILLWILP